MDMRLLVTVYSPVEADLLVSRLVDEGIDARLVNRQTLSIIPIWTVALGGIRVLVPGDQYDVALQLLEKLNAGETALPDEEPEKCPKCGNRKVMERRLGLLGALRAFFFGLGGTPLPAVQLEKRCRWCEKKSRLR
jgi:hypothetical protein